MSTNMNMGEKTQAMTRKIFTLTIVLLLVCLFTVSGAAAREVVDMVGRKVTLPSVIKKVYAPSPYGSYILYAMDPKLMAGLIFPLKEEDKRFLDKSVHHLPVIGGLFGQGQTANMEVLLKQKPDLIILWTTGKAAINEKAEETLNKLNIPYVYAVAENLAAYPDVFLFLGKVLGREERGKMLARYTRGVLYNVAAVVDQTPWEKRPSVYYAEGTDGLKTECNDSIHVELIKLAGDRDVHRCHTASHVGMEKISLEQVIIYDPDVIVVQEETFYDKVFSDPRWQHVKAVREKRVYLVPRLPFNWFDRPPSFMRILGLQWLMGCLYPERYPLDIVREARTFYKLFLGVDVPYGEMKAVIRK